MLHGNGGAACLCAQNGLYHLITYQAYIAIDVTGGKPSMVKRVCVVLQLEICLRQLGDSASEAITILTALEALARLCWNDDEVRTQVSMLYGEHTSLDLPQSHAVVSPILSRTNCHLARR